MTASSSFRVVDEYHPSFFDGKRVLVRVDYNVPLKEKGDSFEVADDQRLRFSLPTINYLLAAKARVVLLSHLGKPKGEEKASFSLQPVAQKLNELAFGLIGYRKKVKFSPQPSGKGAARLVKRMEKGEILVLENSRFLKGEEENSLLLARRWSRMVDFYVNEAFSCSHRRHASIVGLPQFLPHAAGIKLAEEYRFLSNFLSSPPHPVVLVLGGVKEDKLIFGKKISQWADKILVGGKLVAGWKERLAGSSKEKFIVAKLRKDGQDISSETIERFSEEIRKAKAAIFAGPMGNTKEGVFTGTEKLFKAAIDGGVFTLAGGGDTEYALTSLGLADKIDYISSGGGAMLALLADGTLPGIEALEDGNRSNRTDKTYKTYD